MKLDKKDKIILGELLDNCRQSNKEIGKKSNLSREGVASRVRRLESEKIIKSYITEINIAKLGMIQYAVLLKLSGDISKLKDYTDKNSEVISFQRSLGKYNILLSIKAKTPFELSRQLKKIKGIISDQIQELEVSISVVNYDSQSSFFKEPFLTMTIKDTSSPVKLSDTDVRILEELLENSKISLVDLASKTKLSAITVAQKIKQLKSQGIIKNFRVLIDYKKLGLNRYSVALNVKPSQEKNFIEFCKNHKSIIDMSELFGRFNYTAEILAKDNESFRQVIDDISRNFKIQNYEVLILLEEEKHK